MSQTCRRSRPNLWHMQARCLLAQNRYDTVQFYAHDRSKASIFDFYPNAGSTALARLLSHCDRTPGLINPPYIIVSRFIK